MHSIAKPCRKRFQIALFSGLATASLLLAPDQALAQDAVPIGNAEEESSGSAMSEVAAPRASFPVSYFERFAPRTALDMLEQLPGFDLEGGDEGQRGFGQASANVLVNGERLTSKSTSVEDQLSRIPAANVVRIDVVDGTALDLPGLSGQVADVILAESGGISGQFQWQPSHRFRTNMTDYFTGSVSVTGKSGNLYYTVALDNDASRFGARGPTLISDSDGVPIENRETLFRFFSDNPTLTADLRFAPSAEVVTNLNISLTKRDAKTREGDTRDFAIGTDAAQARRFDSDGFQREIAADIAFPAGPGELKLIMLDSSTRRDFTEQAILSFVDGSTPTGRRFAADTDESERIGRAEYRWPMLALDWQTSVEAAFNRLDRTSEFSLLDPSGEFVLVPLPGATGNVKEDRYDFALSASGAISDRLTFQLSAGSEFSTIEDLAEGGLRRSFQRPKGSALLAWAPSQGWDVSLEVARRVGQLDFSDFLASVSLGDDQQNAANAALVPQQSWETELEVSRDLGAWGNATLRVFEERIEDFIDIIPLPDGSAARGNIDSARVRGIGLTATWELAPLGWQGARIDIDGTWESTRLTDPLDNTRRSLSSRKPSDVSIDFRHDIPRSNWAWGGSWSRDPEGRYFRVDEVGREFSGPDFASVFIENKDFAGLTVRSELRNVTGAKRTLSRTVYDGPRTDNVIAFLEERGQAIGLGVRLTVSGNF